jgi:hypothetical protein
VQEDDTSGLRDLIRRRPSLVALAGEAGVSYSYVLKVAAGRRKPNRALRAAVERLYCVPASVVFGDEVARPRQTPKAAS